MMVAILLHSTIVRNNDSFPLIVIISIWQPSLTCGLYISFYFYLFIQHSLLFIYLKLFSVAYVCYHIQSYIIDFKSKTSFIIKYF